MKRPSSAWLLVILAAALLAAVPWARTRLSENLRQSREKQAWRMRCGDALLSLARPGSLARARGLYLEGNFRSCLVALSSRWDKPAVDLRKQAELALVLEVPWPSRVLAHLRVDLDGDRLSELVRVVAPGAGHPPRLEVFMPNRGYDRAPITYLDPAGKPLARAPSVEAVKAMRVGHLTGRDDALIRTGSHLLVLCDGPRAYVFPARAKVVHDGVRTDHLWRWKGGRFQAVTSK